MQKTKIYILSQLFGWFLYIILAGVVSQFNGKDFSVDLLITLFSVFAIGLFTSHIYKMIINHLEWQKMNIRALIPRVLISSAVFAVIFQVLYFIVYSIFIMHQFNFKWIDFIEQIFNWGILFIIWSLIYFTYNFFENFRKEEIKNLQWEATKNEIELNRLKSQLNPHFIFNSMNTIRALIEEDPQKAKKSVTQLSNILRSSFTMGKQKTITFEEELKLVNDYLEIEKTRYEERLQFSWDIHPQSLNFPVPAMMLQTIVENSIKHGISTLPQGGKVCIRSYFNITKLVIEIENDGVYDAEKKSESGYGLSNTIQRLNLLYGEDAHLTIFNTVDKTVKTLITLPNTTKI
tara:strand:- start:4561 stop:5601 length:1041 start_codon:yes stop_codon:yes gene_type:complete